MVYEEDAARVALCPGVDITTSVPPPFIHRLSCYSGQAGGVEAQSCSNNTLDASLFFDGTLDLIRSGLSTGNVTNYFCPLILELGFTLFISMTAKSLLRPFKMW